MGSELRATNRKSENIQTDKHMVLVFSWDVLTVRNIHNTTMSDKTIFTKSN